MESIKLGVNIKTAKVLDIKIPESIMIRTAGGSTCTYATGGSTCTYATGGSTCTYAILPLAQMR